MREFRIEAESDFKYKNGVEFFLQTTKAFGIGATAHIHNSIEIICVNTGSFTVYADDDKYEIFAGDMILFRSNVIHHIFAGANENNSYYVLKIKPDVIRDLAPAAMGGVYLLSFAFKRSGAKCVWTKSETESIGEIVHGFDCLKNELSSDKKYNDIAIKLAAGSVLLGLLRSGADEGEQSVPDATDRIADCIYKAMTYINRNYKEDITVADVCSVVGMSYCYFSRSFKHIIGKSFKEYLNLTRINHAERLLATTDKTVSAICSECGYNDVSYFIKVYKEHKLTAPGTFRAMHKKGDAKKVQTARKV